MILEWVPNEMGIPAMLLVAIVVIAVATWMLDLLFPESNKPAHKSGPR